MSVTLKDVAQAARVSISTASRALGGGGLASERTQQRLARIARELGYRPNPIARGLKTGQSRLVGLLIHNLGNASFQVMAEVVQARLRTLGYQMLLCIAGDDPQQERDTLATLADHRINGLIVVPTGKNGAKLTALDEGDIPIVCVVRRDDKTELETVLAALREASIAVEDSLVHAGHFEPETGAVACRRFLDLKERPSAIFVANHESVLGVLRVTAERGLSIPGDLSILCYEDAPWFEWHRPALSVIDSGARDLANLAVDRLLQRMKAKNRHAEGGSAESAREYRVGARLVKRDSCRPLQPAAAEA